MAHDLLRTLLELVEVLRPAVTRPSYANLLVVFSGWVMTTGTHSVTQALVTTAVAGRRHHEAFHRFFSRGTWSPDEMGRLLFQRLLLFIGDAPLRVAVDDTLAPKKGPHVFGIGSHLDAVRSTRRRKAFCFGHVWVVLALVMPVPFSRRTWALPILLRLYRNKKEAVGGYRKKTELAREMLDIFAGWADGRRVEVAADSAYCCDTVTRALPKNFVLFGAMRPDAVLTKLPKAKKRARGRPAIRGAALPKPEAVAKDPKRPWATCTADLYGRTTTVQYKTLVGQWYRACGPSLLRVVVVKCSSGTVPYRVFFAMEPTLSVREILEGYARRWSIEVCFRDLKQLAGFADSSARKREAVERTAPFVGLIYTMLTLWFIEGASASPLAAPPLRPWYRNKRGLCFADILRTAQRVLASFDVLDPASSFGNLRQPALTARTPAPTPKRGAA